MRKTMLTPNLPRFSLPKSAIDTKVGVRFVVTGVLHEDAWEGSCRVGDLEELTYEAERAELERRLAALERELESRNLPPEVELIKPTSIYSWAEKGNPDIAVPNEQLEVLQQDDEKTDVYIVTHAHEGLKIAERYKKPVIIMQKQGYAVDMPAAIRSMGVDSFHVEDLETVFDFVRLFAVKKAFKQTKLLSVTNFPKRVPWGVASSISDLDFIKDRYGMDYKYLDYKEFFGKMDKMTKERAVQDEANRIARVLMDNATENNMTQEDIKYSVLFYLAALKIMSEHNCNAFTIECFELCSSLNPWNRRFTPCLTHALLKDGGYPSACEGDINALLAMAVEMYLSRKAVYMGNPNIDKKNNILNIHHSVASLKMEGIDNIESSYQIHSFTKSGFGVTLRHDFNKDKGKVVTVGRFDPSGTKMLITKGEVIGGGGLGGYGCSQNVDIKIPNGYEFWRESQNFGHHLALVFGDYVNQIRDLGNLMNFDVVAIL